LRSGQMLEVKLRSPTECISKKKMHRSNSNSVSCNSKAPFLEEYVGTEKELFSGDLTRVNLIDLFNSDQIASEII
jgi:hypothetical protein